MRKPGTQSCCLINWMLALALALALAPMQSAWSAFDSRCMHEQDMQPAQNSNTGHASVSHALQKKDCSHHVRQRSTTSVSSTAGDCCCHTQDNGGDRCTGTCQQAPASLYLPPLKLSLFLEVFTDFEIQHPNLNHGRTVPPPYQPPRS